MFKHKALLVKCQGHSCTPNGWWQNEISSLIIGHNFFFLVNTTTVKLSCSVHHTVMSLFYTMRPMLTLHVELRPPDLLHLPGAERRKKDSSSPSWSNRDFSLWSPLSQKIKSHLRNCNPVAAVWGTEHSGQQLGSVRGSTLALWVQGYQAHWEGTAPHTLTRAATTTSQWLPPVLLIKTVT